MMTMMSRRMSRVGRRRRKKRRRGGERLEQAHY